MDTEQVPYHHRDTENTAAKAGNGIEIASRKRFAAISTLREAQSGNFIFPLRALCVSVVNLFVTASSCAPGA